MNYRSLIFISIVAYSALLAAQAKPDAVKAMTIGDLLKKANDESRGASVEQIEKNKILLPQLSPSYTEKKEKNLNEIKPPKTSDFYKNESHIQAEYEKTLDLQIEELYKLTQKHKTSKNRGELWLRLAELYVEKSGVEDNKKQNEYDKKLADFQNKKTTLKPILDMQLAQEYNKKSIQLYSWFLKDFETDSKAHQALFFLGYNYFELGNVEQGIKYYEQLIAKFPTSSYAAEAHFTLGESLFEKEHWSAAYKEYSVVIKNNKHNLYTMALYKAAWCLYRLGKTEEGIKYLDHLIKNGNRNFNSTNLNHKKVNTTRLESEAIKDLVVFFADFQDTEKAIAYFNKLSPKDAKNNIEKLAYYLTEKENIEASFRVFKYLIALDPLSKKAFEYQYQIVQNYLFSKNNEAFKTELYLWISGYSIKSSWYSVNKIDPNFINNCDQLREQTLKNYILQQHQTAQNSRAAFSQKSAEAGYKLYFQEFGNSKHSAEMHFFYGELLYDMRKYTEAAAAYEYTAYTAGASEYTEKAAQNILLSLEKNIPTDEKLQASVVHVGKAVKIDDHVDLFIKASLRFLQKYPKAEKAAEIKFRIGRLYYLSNNFSEAENQFKEIIKLYPGTKYSEYSANLLLDIYNLKKDYAGLEKIGAELLTNESLSKASIGGDIRGIIEKASFKRAQSLEEEKKYFESAEQFYKFAMQNPSSDLAGLAFFNAGVNYERTKKNKDAIGSYKKLLNSDLKMSNDIRYNSKRLLAKLYQNANHFDESAELYSFLAKTYVKDAKRASFLFNSALMHELLGNYKRAISEYESYLKINSNKSENAQVAYKIAQLLQKAHDFKGAIDAYKKVYGLQESSLEVKIEAKFQIYRLSKDLKIKINALSYESDIQNLSSALSPNSKIISDSYLAKIKFDRANEGFENFKIIKISGTGAKQSKSVKNKLELMTRLNQQLNEIMQLNSAAEIVSALCLLGELNEYMANELKSVPVPTGLSEHQKTIYTNELMKIIEPLSAKADQSFKLAIDKAKGLQIYNEAYTKSYQVMNKKFPDEYYDLGEISEGSNIIHWAGEE